MPRPQGFVLLWLLFWVAGLGVGMAALGTLWQTASQREKEAELLFVGDQYRKAIEAYHRRSPGGQPRYPARLEDLLQDPRFPQTVRHLRRLYVDPLTGKAEWGIVKAADGGIAGVYSLAATAPRKTGGFPARYADFAGSDTYQGWQFQADPAQTGAPGTETGTQDTEVEDAEADGTSSSITPPDSLSTPEAAAERLARILPCETAKQAEYRQCADQHHPHNPAAWQACTQTANARYAACIR
ncbi:MAG: type II secretion system protein [Pseudomonadota bacterium]